MKEFTENQQIDQVGLAIWQTHLEESAKKPWLAGVILKHGSKILRRFIHFYRRLRSQPRRIRRFLQAKTATTLVGASLLLALSNTPVHAATISVDGTTCTLIDAITAANTDIATGGCVAGSGADTIVLQAGSTLTLYGPSGLPTVSSNITISGNGATIEADGSAPPFSLLEVDNSGDLTLNNITLSNSQGSGIYSYGGSLTINDSTISGNASNGIESGLYSNIEINDTTFTGNSGYGVSAGFGSLTVNNSMFSGNGAGVGGFSEIVEINNSTISGSSGAGISTYEGPLTVNDSIVTGNSGGGIYASGGAGEYDVNITNSTISNNTGNGGFSGFYANINISNSIITNNSGAYDGGGVYVNRFVTLNINNSTISGNVANDRGGGVFSSDSYGTEINNSTISNNQANAGGGVFNYIGELILNDSTVTGNTANIGGGAYGYYDPVTFNRSIVSGNSAPNSREVYMQYAYSPADNYNLFGYNGDAGVSGFTLGATDIVPAAGVQVSDILDTTLQNNGGDTDTHALVSGSPAIDAVPAGVCTTATDQRGVSRPQGTDCDIGAFELESLSQDTDGDGIFDDVDTQPTTFSDDFSDTGLGGTTAGSIADRGDQDLTIEEEANPLGVKVTAAPSGGAAPADITACGGIGDVSLDAGEIVDITCSSITVDVLNGDVDLNFTADDGTPSSTTLSAGNSVTFDPTTLTFTAPASNTQTVVILLNGESLSLDPGETITVAAAAEDSFLRSGNSNTNEGANLNMVVRSSGKNRALVSFDVSALSSTVNEATIRLYIVHNANNWSNEGRTIDAHQVLEDWVEGDGANMKPANLTNAEFNPYKNRGEGPGVTWKCAIDSEVSNQKADCDPKWNGGNYDPTPSDTVTIFKDFGGNNQLPPTTQTVGWIEFDVTADVNECIANGDAQCSWLIRKTNEGQNGRVEFATKEGAAAFYDTEFGEPVTSQLVVESDS